MYKILKRKKPSIEELKLRKFVEQRNRLSKILENLDFKLDDIEKEDYFYVKQVNDVEYYTDVCYRYNNSKLIGESFVDTLNFIATFTYKGIEISLKQYYHNSYSEENIIEAYKKLEQKVNTIIKL